MFVRERVQGAGPNKYFNIVKLASAAKAGDAAVASADETDPTVAAVPAAPAAKKRYYNLDTKTKELVSLVPQRHVQANYTTNHLSDSETVHASAHDMTKVGPVDAAPPEPAREKSLEEKELTFDGLPFVTEESKFHGGYIVQEDGVPTGFLRKVLSKGDADREAEKKIKTVSDMYETPADDLQAGGAFLTTIEENEDAEPDVKTQKKDKSVPPSDVELVTRDEYLALLR